MKERKERKIIPKIVDTRFHFNDQGQHTHYARNNNNKTDAFTRASACTSLRPFVHLVKITKKKTFCYEQNLPDISDFMQTNSPIL